MGENDHGTGIEDSKKGREKMKDKLFYLQEKTKRIIGGKEKAALGGAAFPFAAFSQGYG